MYVYDFPVVGSLAAVPSRWRDGFGHLSLSASVAASCVRSVACSVGMMAWGDLSWGCC